MTHKQFRQPIYKPCIILHNFRMNKAQLFFHIAKQDGLEFVFTSGNALSYPTHTHISVYTITIVRRGIVQLTRQDSTDIYPAGSMYTVAPYEPHSPAYLDTFDIVSLCVDKKHFFKMSRLSLITNCLRYTHYLLEQNWLSQDTIKGLLDGINSIYDATRDANKAPTAQPTILEYLKPVNTKQMLDENLHLSRFHFIRKFKNETGITPHQYVVQSRIREVKKLLTNDIPIADAAVLAGFCDQSHLNRWFNRSIGITPQLYKKSCFFWEG